MATNSSFLLTRRMIVNVRHDTFGMGQLNPRMIRIAGIALAILVVPALVSMLPRVLILGVLPRQSKN